MWDSGTRTDNNLLAKATEYYDKCSSVSSEDSNFSSIAANVGLLPKKYQIVII